MTKIVVLTGATGFVGRELGVALVRAGWQVRALTRDPERARGTLPYPATLYKLGDEVALTGCDAVIHLLGEPIAEGRWTEERKRSIRDSRVESTRALAALIRAMPKKPAVFIQASGIGYYGDRGDEELDETAAPGDDFLAKVCVDWEREGLPLADVGVRAVAMRTGMVLGHQGGALPKIAAFYHKGLGGRLGSGRQWVSWIHLDDLVALFLHALETSSLQGPVNAIAPEPCRFEDFHQALLGALGSSSFLPAPALGLKLALGEKAVIVLGSQRGVPRAAERSGFRWRHRRIDDAFGALYADAVQPGAARLLVRQWVPKPPEQVWPFFCDETNLERITPPWLGFHVEGKSTPQLGEGTEIRYKLKLHGLPLRWVSRIEQWRPPQSFVDVQTKGPYKLWHHTHAFEPLDGGTLLTDSVQYKLPLGALGGLAALPAVEHDVARIFAYRQAVVVKEFGTRP
jgi:hypothetical protein